MQNRYKIFVLILITLIIAIMTLAKPFRVSGDCMEPAVIDGQFVFLNRISPYLRQYQIGDIIVFNYEGKPWISRIVALQNNTIKIIENKITVNDIPLEDGIDRNWSGWDYGTYGINKTFLVKAGHVYVLSDNLCAHHDDSRVFGAISYSSILGVTW